MVPHAVRRRRRRRRLELGSAVSDTGFITNGTTGFGFSSADASNWNLAWSAQAGVAYNVSSNLKLELASRYLNWLGQDPGRQLLRRSGAGHAGPAAYYTLTNFDALDFKLGMRWMFQPEAPVYCSAAHSQGLNVTILELNGAGISRAVFIWAQ